MIGGYSEIQLAGRISARRRRGLDGADANRANVLFVAMRAIIEHCQRVSICTQLASQALRESIAGYSGNVANGNNSAL
jgi:hypothetical protein